MTSTLCVVMPFMAIGENVNVGALFRRRSALYIYYICMNVYIPKYMLKFAEKRDIATSFWLVPQPSKL